VDLYDGRERRVEGEERVRIVAVAFLGREGDGGGAEEAGECDDAR
jgi:hypothetical protein